MMDISSTLEPNSDQLDAVELLGGPRIFTIERVSRGNEEQPVNVHLLGFPRPWRPGVSMRRVLASCWGVDASAWVGRRVELYCDPNVRFGSEAVGGTRIAKLSHIAKEQKIPLLVSRGKSATFIVLPLANAAPASSSQAAAEPADTPGPNVGGLQIASADDAMRVIRAMSDDQVKALKALLRSDATTKSALAAELFDQRAGWFAEDVLREIQGVPS